MNQFRPITGLIPDRFWPAMYAAYCAALMPGSVRAETFTVTIATPTVVATPFEVKTQPPTAAEVARPAPSAAPANAPGITIAPTQPMQLWRMYDAQGNTWQEWRAVPPQVMPPPGVAAPPFRTTARDSAVQPGLVVGNPDPGTSQRMLRPAQGVRSSTFHAGHNCPACGTAQYRVAGYTGQGTHRHVCPRCGTGWEH